MSDVTIPKARVWPKPDGTLRFNQWEGARRPDDEGWWDDVLRDPRAKAPTDTYISNEHHARWRLDRQDEWIECVCPCGLYHWMDRDKLINEVGGNMNVAHLVREWMPCRERNKMANYCRAYVVRLGK
jgi:hypothetical protein